MDGSASRFLPLQDTGVQFHPTGIMVLLLSYRGCEGEGGYLTEAFMERYAPSAKDLAPRDVVSRSMTIEIREGRVGKDNDHIYLHLEHPGADVLHSAFLELQRRRKFFRRDATKEPIPVLPCALQYGRGPNELSWRGASANQG